MLFKRAEVQGISIKWLRRTCLLPPALRLPLLYPGRDVNNVTDGHATEASANRDAVVQYVPATMGRALSTDLKERIVALYLHEQWPMQHIAETLHCSVGLISKVVNNYRDYGEVNKPPQPDRRLGRPRKLKDEDIQLIHSLLRANPAILLDELQRKLSIIRGVEVSKATLSRMLHTHGLSRKQITE